VFRGVSADRLASAALPQSQLHQFLTDSRSDDDFNGRMAAQYSLPVDHGAYHIRAAKSDWLHPAGSSTGRSGTSLSSAASEDASTQAPSLSLDGSTVPSSRYSVGTSLASAASGYPLLDLETGFVVVSPSVKLECAFWFLGCGYSAEPDDTEEWKTHCLSHFRGSPPPRTVVCPLCGEFEGSTFNDGYEAWDARMDHVAFHHDNGYSLAASRPDFKLFQYLWKKKIISNAELKELKGNTHLSHPNRIYTVSSGEARAIRI